MLITSFPNITTLVFDHNDYKYFMKIMRTFVMLNNNNLLQLHQIFLNMNVQYTSDYQHILPNIKQFMDLFKIIYVCTLYHFIPNIFNKNIIVKVCGYQINLDNIKQLYNKHYQNYFYVMDINLLHTFQINYIAQYAYMVTKIIYNKN